MEEDIFKDILDKVVKKLNERDEEARKITINLNSSDIINCRIAIRQMLKTGEIDNYTTECRYRSTLEKLNGEI